MKTKMATKHSLKILSISAMLALGVNAEASLKKAAETWENKNDPKRYENVVYELIDSNMYFSAVPFAALAIEANPKLDQKFELALESLILKTGTAAFIGIEANDLWKHKIPSLSLVLGLKLFKAEQYEKVSKVLNTIADNHRFTPEARMIQGSAYNLSQNYGAAIAQYERCVTTASKLESQAKHEKLKRYYAILKESCTIHMARVKYKEKDFKGSLLAYNEIPKTSYRWPYILMEKAWASYYMEDYNRTLGLLVTYKSPLMESYFFPEGEVLGALSYYKLCLYSDSMSTIDQYYKVYKSRSDDLKKILIEHKASNSYFLKLMFAPIDQSEQKNPFIRNLVTQIRKKIKFSVDLVSLKTAQNEWDHLNKLKESSFVKELKKHVGHHVVWRSHHLNHFVKKEMFDFLNDMHRFSYEMFNIRLEIMSDKRGLIYENKKLIADRARGTKEGVNRLSSEHFYDFNGEFWADELGDFSFGLISNCQAVKVTTSKK